MGDANYVKVRYLGEREITRVKTSEKCNHTETMCWECADIWSVDYEIFADDTAMSRALKARLNKYSPDKALMNGEIAWRK